MMSLENKEVPDTVEEVNLEDSHMVSIDPDLQVSVDQTQKPQVYASNS